MTETNSAAGTAHDHTSSPQSRALNLRLALDETRIDSRTWIAALVVSLFAFLLYCFTLAPGITWAHQGADGGELLAAAVTRGVPHPPGYPLYTMLLGGWLTAIGWVAPFTEIAWRGNLLSALFGAASAGITVLAARSVLALAYPAREAGVRGDWLWAAIAGLAWAASPLLWSQSIITEVYALHAFIFALLGWVLLGSRRRWWMLTIPVALGVAHHITLLLLLPAALWWVWEVERGLRRVLIAVAWMALGAAIGGLLYLYIPFVGAAHRAPVNWGYVSNPEEFWWLVSGAAYRSYLFATPTESIFLRVAQWAYTLVVQYTPIGLVLALLGLAWLDQGRSALRTFGILWIVPLSVYSIGYYTRDSEIYLLPVTWMLALWLAVGLAQSAQWLGTRFTNTSAVRGILTGGMLVVIAANLALFWQQTSLRNDRTAIDYLEQVDAILPEKALVVSRGDKETFALWYGAWGNEALTDGGRRRIIPVNDSLYQFAWYRRLQGDLYHDLPAVSVSVNDLIEWNRFLYPVYYTEELPVPEGMSLEPQPPLWRLVESETLE